ncbi:MAG: hypothetical protein KDI51_16565 [Xanthomonadales bacterium]|nr:hypothetical protein [Xanthomonadales bacterium]
MTACRFPPGAGDDELRISSEHIVDHHAPTRPGEIGYHYDFVLYRFKQNGRELLARSYADTAERVSLLNLRVDGATRPLVEADLRDGLAVNALAHLKALGKSDFSWFDQAAGRYREWLPGSTARAPNDT